MSDEPAKPRKNMDWFLALLTGVLVSGFMTVLASLFLLHVPEGNKEIMIYMVGQLSGFTGAVVALWTNTTYNSSRKTDMIAKANPVDMTK